MATYMKINIITPTSCFVKESAKKAPIIAIKRTIAKVMFMVSIRYLIVLGFSSALYFS